MRELLAVQAQDLRAARLALRARSERLIARDVDAAISDGSLVVAWLMRGTLHLVGREDYPWLLSLTAPTRFSTSSRRLAQERVSPDEAGRALRIVERALAEEGPLTRPELAERLAAEGIRTAGQATPHLLMLAALRGIAVLGPLRGGRQAFALTRDWLGTTPPVARQDALAELARRYLAAHGPATAADLAAWSALALRDARAGLESIARELVELDAGLLDLAAREPGPDRIPPRLLPAFDPYMLGWKDRTFAVPAEYARRVHPGGGTIRPVATAQGLAVGTWGARRRLDRVTVEIEPFVEPPADVASALADEAGDLARFEGLRLTGAGMQVARHSRLT